MPAAVVLDAYPDHTFDAAVVKIYPEADRQKGTVKGRAFEQWAAMRLPRWCSQCWAAIRSITGRWKS
jgi:hypothetical protein